MWRGTGRRGELVRPFGKREPLDAFRELGRELCAATGSARAAARRNAHMRVPLEFEKQTLHERPIPARRGLSNCFIRGG